MKKVIQKMTMQVYVILLVACVVNLAAVIGTMYLQLRYINSYFLDILMASIPAVVTVLVTTAVAAFFTRTIFKGDAEKLSVSAKIRKEKQSKKMEIVPEDEQDYKKDLDSVLEQADSNKESNEDSSGESAFDSLGYPDNFSEDDLKNLTDKEDAVDEEEAQDAAWDGVELDIASPEAYTATETRYVQALMSALLEVSVDKENYSVGYFVPGKVSIFEAKAGTWFVSDKNAAHASQGEMYPNIVKAGSAFASLLS